MNARLTITSPLGPLHLEAHGGALTSLTFSARDTPGGAGSQEDQELLREAARQLRAYFAGELREFDLPLRPRGTGFQRRVWEALQQIPYGETRSYGQQAESLGVPGAARAVGAANGKNPISIIVPCHRVIGADGTLTGFGGGLKNKERLLRLEGAL